MDLMENCGSGSFAKAVVVGLGNPYRTDDGVGIAVLRVLKGGDAPRVTRDGEKSFPPPVTRHASPVTEFLESAHGGFSLAQALIGFERALIVDAAPFLPVGEVAFLSIYITSGIKPDATEPSRVASHFMCDVRLGCVSKPITNHGSRITDHGLWLHGLGLAEAFELLAAAGEDVPEVWALGIGVPDDPPFGEELSAKVAVAIPKAIVEVERWLKAGF